MSEASGSPGITRTEARQIALAVILAESLGTGASRARLLREMKSPPHFYNRSEIELSECWIVYVKRETLMLISSLIVVISQKTGEVIYVGPANDEG